MDTVTKWISELAPFLAPYPPFVKVLFATWVALGAALFVALILARSDPPSQTSSARGEASATHEAGAQSADRGPPNTPRDVWMVIDGLQFFAARDGAQVRVVANVNGTEFIYPSRAGVEWLEVGPSMSAQIFRLPPTKQRYVIRFEASVRVPARRGEPAAKGQLTSVKEDVVNIATDVPFNGRYILHTFDPVHRARSADANAELQYRITYEPK